MVKDSSAAAETRKPKRFRDARASLRLHPNLKAALDFLSDCERRTLSQYLEIVVLRHVQETLIEEFDRRGVLIRGMPPGGKFTFRDAARHRRGGL